MKHKLFKFTTIALPLLLSGVSGGNAATEVECTIFPPAQIFPGQTFDLRISRVPGYPGGWFAPTFITRVTYPTTGGWEYTQIEKRTVPKTNVIRVDETFYAPYSLYPDPDAGFVPGGIVNITVMVRDQGADQQICTAQSVISP